MISSSVCRRSTVNRPITNQYTDQKRTDLTFRRFAGQNEFLNMFLFANIIRLFSEPVLRYCVMYICKYILVFLFWYS